MKNLFELFKQYVLWGLTYKILSSLYGYSVRSLEEKFHSYFLKDPPLLPLIDQSNTEEAYLLICLRGITRLLNRGMQRHFPPRPASPARRAEFFALDEALLKIPRA